jgi:hypothetical protein
MRAIPRDGRKRVPAHGLLHSALLLVDVALKGSLVWLHLPTHGAGAVSDFDHVAFAEAPLLRAVIRHLLRRVHKGGGGGSTPLMTPTNQNKPGGVKKNNSTPGQNFSH